MSHVCAADALTNLSRSPTTHLRDRHRGGRTASLFSGINNDQAQAQTFRIRACVCDTHAISNSHIRQTQFQQNVE